MAFFQPQIPSQEASTNPYGSPSATIEPTQIYLQQLRSMTHRHNLLIKNGFVVTPLSQADIDDKKRCSSKRNRYRPDAQDNQKGHKRPPQKPSTPQPKAKIVPVASADASVDNGMVKENEEKSTRPVLKCQYHTGRVIRMQWNCCRTHVSAPGCTFAPDHLTRTYAPGDLLARHQFHRTPSSPLLDLNRRPLVPISGQTDPTSYTPSGLPRHPRPAVALDCEMGVAFDGESELIRLTLIDYFTSEILLDSLVYPTVRMQHYNTRYSGVSRQDMNEARDKGKCLIGGLAAAREEVWRWVGPETIVIGHAVQNDLASLRWIHPLVVDSLILATAAKAEQEKMAEEEEERKKVVLKLQETGIDDDDLIIFDGQETSETGNSEEKEKQEPNRHNKGGGLSLKSLARDLLGRVIQAGKMGHDSLEDALASRDLVHWYVTQKCEELEAYNQDKVQAIPGFW
ncbi:3'-5' exonuclease [Colletotrichum truncatum]|uniref:3'-5' exonuclease n=1 Tax=Colletotrichum truncatum TaxID=5467 RepID=A0ACC3YLC3_COLTU